VDKPNFFHKLKGLRAPQALGQGLCRARTETGQKNGGAQVGQFRTFVPVDMHAFIHSAASFLPGRPGFQLLVCLQGLSVPCSGRSFAVATWSAFGWPDRGHGLDAALT
jgi:hypothetical protein